MDRQQNEGELEVEDHLGRDDYGELRSAAKVPEWEGKQEYSGEGTEIYDSEPGCPLDGIPDLTPNSNKHDEKIHGKTDNYTIVEAEHLKNHAVRDMAIWNEHGWLPNKKEKQKITEDLIDEAYDRIKKEDVEYMILHGNMSSINDHYHILCSSLEEDEEDLGAFQDYAVFRLEDEPVLLDYRIETESGETVFPSEQWLEENYGRENTF
jgi:hypothetical protein